MSLRSAAPSDEESERLHSDRIHFQEWIREDKRLHGSLFYFTSCWTLWLTIKIRTPVWRIFLLMVFYLSDPKMDICPISVHATPVNDHLLQPIACTHQIQSQRVYKLPHITVRQSTHKIGGGLVGGINYCIDASKRQSSKELQARSNMATSDEKPSSAAATTTTPTAATGSSTSGFGGSVWTLRKSLFAVLAALVVLVVWSIGAEYSVLATAKSSFLGIIHSASGVDNGEDDSTAGLEYYPKEVFETDWSTKIPDAELLHVSTLHKACLKYKDSVIPWNFGLERDSKDENGDDTSTRDNPEDVLVNENDPDLLEKLRQCPDIDVFLPPGLRGFGYCEDAVAYTKCECISVCVCVLLLLSTVLAS